MKIVVLDGHTLVSDDLSWDVLQAMGDCDIYDRTPKEKVLSRLEGVEIAFTNKVVLDAEIISKLPKLKYIGVLAAGYNVVDLNAAAERGIPVTNVPEYGTESVAQMVFAHILNLCNRIAEHSSSVSNGDWSNSKDFCYWNHPQIELLEKTIGIVGWGKIGKSVAKLARAFGMEVLVSTRSKPDSLPDGVSLASDLTTLFRESDIISLHCPLTEENQGFVNAELIAQMKSDAFLINTGRGSLIDEVALAEALNQNKIAGAGLDVLVKEPADPDCPLLTAKNCFITPHIAWATHGARKRLLNTAIENLKGFLNGKKLNVVNKI